MTGGHSTATASQAWAILARHAREEIAPLRLRELCRDNDRVSSLVTVYNTQQQQQQDDNNNNNNENNNSNPNHILIADLSRQRMTLETVNHLLKLAAATGLRQFIRRLAWGQNNPLQPILPARVVAQQQQQSAAGRNKHANNNAKAYINANTNITNTNTASTKNEDSQQKNHTMKQHTRTTIRPSATMDTLDESINNNIHYSSSSSSSASSMHMALRVLPRQPNHPPHEMLLADGTNALTDIHHNWKRWERLSNAIRTGQLRGVTNHVIRHVIVVGQGLPVAALQFVYQALRRDETAVVASRDGLPAPADAASAAARLLLRRNYYFSTATATANAGNGSGSGNTNTSSKGTMNSTATAPASRQLHFLTRVDPVAAAAVVAGLDPAATMVISIALNGNEETGLATKTLKSWLLAALAGGNSNSNHHNSSSSNSRTAASSSSRPDLVLEKHMHLITGNERIAAVINKPESVHLVPEHSRCEAFSTFSAASLLPLSIVFGWPVVEKFLAGAHDMDKHFVETNPRHNIPVLLALADVWNDTLLGASSSRMITPFSESMVGFPAFCAALEAQTCSRARNSSSSGSTTATAANAGTFWNKPTCSSLVLDGGVDGAYDRSLYQSPTLINSEIVAVMDNQVYFNTARTIGANNNMEDVHTAQDAVMCSLFAHCDELAFGSERSLENTHPSTPPSFSMSSSNKPEGGEVLEGNRASMLLMCGKLDAFACGQLVALAEHRAVVKAHIWGIDPFVREVGSSLRANRMDSLKEELQHLFTKKPEAASGGNLSLSTKTMLEHYATLMQDTRTKR